jgi:hypothetical protein
MNTLTFKDVEIGDYSASGLAQRVKFGDAWKWVPCSVIERVVRDPRTRGKDSVTLQKWWAIREELEEGEEDDPPSIDNRTRDLF